MVVDDEESSGASLSDGRGGRYHVRRESGRKALERLPERNWDLMLVASEDAGDGRTPLMDEVHKTAPECVIIMTAYATVDTAVSAMKKGATTISSNRSTPTTSP